MWGACGVYGVVQSAVIEFNRRQREAQEEGERPLCTLSSADMT
jgi:hypothetical protein